MTRIDKEIKLLKWIAVIALAVVVAVLNTLVVTAVSSQGGVLVFLKDLVFWFR